MNEDQKVYYPEEIVENSYPNADAELSFASTNPENKDITQQESIKAQSFPTRRVAHELLASALNTRSRKILQEFQFTKSGSIQVGEYQNGVSGDLRLTPNGLTARDSSGLTTFSIDGTTGDAVFKGSVQSGSIITGQVQVGGDNIILDGDIPSFELRDENGNVVIFIGYQKDAF